ncbi:MAG: hypothetical protein ACC647_03660 [Anaerolineales bacterium]
MRANSSPTWLVIGIGLFSVATLIWLLFPTLSDGGAAAQMAVPSGLFSRLVPDYGSDNLGDVFRTLRLTIVRELTGDGLEQQLLLPVPTATWRDFAGAAPYTATPTNTPTSTNTPTPTSTATATNTATRRPTSTRTPTEKAEEKPPPPPTNTPTITPTPSDTPTPTSTPTPIPDVAGPDVILERIEGTHESSTCMFTIDFSVEDPEPSAGVENSQVHLFYEYPIGSGDAEASLSGGGNWLGGVPGNEWAGTYTGQIFGVSTGDRVKFSVEVKDNAGYRSLPSGFTFDVDADCRAIDI